MHVLQSGRQSKFRNMDGWTMDREGGYSSEMKHLEIFDSFK